MMKRSKIASFIGIISLVLQIYSYTITPAIGSIFAYAFLALGISFSVLFLIPAIILDYYEFRSRPYDPEKYGKRRWVNVRKLYDTPLGPMFSTYSAISFLLIGMGMGFIMFEQVPPTGSPTLGVVLVILWIICGILGIVAAIVYHDDKSPKKRIPKSIIWD